MPGGPWGAFMGPVGAYWGPLRSYSYPQTFSIYIFVDFLKVCYITFEINLLAISGGPTRVLSRAPQGSNFKLGTTFQQSYFDKDII